MNEIKLGRTVTSYERTSFILNGDIVNGNIIKWGTKQVFGNYIVYNHSYTVFGNYMTYFPKTAYDVVI